MYNPLARDQIGANVTGGLAGWRAHKDGASPMEAFNIGMWWRAWYKSLTMAVVITVVGAIGWPQRGGNGWLFVYAQVVLDVWVFGVTYVSLVLASGFKQRMAFRWFFWFWTLVPNVARFWWYLSLLLPWWTFTMFRWFVPLAQRSPY